MAGSSSSSSSYSLADSSVKDWSYVAEGGANLVVAYTGNDSASPFAGSVLRIRKWGHGKPTLDPATLAEEDASVAFTDHVVIPLLPLNATPRLVSIPVTEDWLCKIHDHIEPHRPPTRRAVDKIDIERSYVVLADNLVGSNQDGYQQLSVEIKPKWGFLPRPKHLSEASRAIKTRYCRFCLHRLHRQHGDGSGGHHNSQATDYCPLDLYSQQGVRVEKAVRALVASWQTTNGKGNNLKMFLEGKMILPDDVPVGFFPHEDVESYLVATLVPFIASSQLVRHLAVLQAELDRLDIEGLRTAVLRKSSVDIAQLDIQALEKLGGEINLPEYEAFVAKYGKSVVGASATDTATRLDEDQPARELIIGHLLSAAFKDCSMFVRIRSPGDLPLTFEDGKHQRPDMQAFLVDCDTKSLDRLSKYVRMDQELVETCTRYLAEGRELASCKQ